MLTTKLQVSGSVIARSARRRSPPRHHLTRTTIRPTFAASYMDAAPAMYSEAAMMESGASLQMAMGGAESGTVAVSGEAPAAAVEKAPAPDAVNACGESSMTRGVVASEGAASSSQSSALAPSEKALVGSEACTKAVEAPETPLNATPVNATSATGKPGRKPGFKSGGSAGAKSASGGESASGKKRSSGISADAAEAAAADIVDAAVESAVAAVSSADEQQHPAVPVEGADAAAEAASAKRRKMSKAVAPAAVDVEGGGDACA